MRTKQTLARIVECLE
ncbi:hypothetical protein NGA_0661300, partial [Nannochloropsis gaditana CCMP526]